MTTPGLTIDRPVWALAMAESGATCIAPGVITRRYTGPRETFVVVRFLRPIRGEHERTYGLAHDYVTPRTEARYSGSDECIDFGSHIADPHSPACPFAG